jgi:hypothetical protein
MAAPPAWSSCAACSAPPKGTPPALLAKDLGLPEQSPAMPEWLTAWSASCDGMSGQLRMEEAKN